MNRKRKQKLHQIYSLIPKIKCKGLCQSYCGAIGMQEGEYEEMVKNAQGKVPSVKPGTLVCNYLNKEGRCDIYEDRPLICRAWGVVPYMGCPHGCDVERMMTNEEFTMLFKKVINVAGPRTRLNCSSEQWELDKKLRRQILEDK